VRVQLSLGVKRLPAHFAPRPRLPVVVLVGHVRSVFRSDVWVAVVGAGVRGAGVRTSASRQVVVVLQPVHDEEVAGQRVVGGVAEAALLALVRRAVRLVLGDVQAEGGRILGAGEAADGALVAPLEDVDLGLLHRWWLLLAIVARGTLIAVLLLLLLLLFLWFSLGAGGLWQTIESL